MLRRRTDLAVEAEALWRESAAETGALRGVKVRQYRRGGFPMTRVDILDGEGARALGKPVGTYRTMDLKPCLPGGTARSSDAAQALGRELRPLLPRTGCVLVAGLGNRSMTPDAVGPLTVDQLLVTRHLTGALPDLRPVCAAAAGVLGTTGLEAAEWIRGMARAAGCAAVVAVDALASRSPDRLCAAVQLSDTGIVPGSGVGNRRMALNRESLGIPVISLGVPTVVDTLTLALDLLGEEGERIPPALGRRAAALFVTPREVDAQIRALARILALGINLALQPALTLADIQALVE